MADNNWNDPRPLSPHLQLWRFHATMVASITHRFTGVILYLGVLGIAAWVSSLILGEDLFSCVSGLISSTVGQILLFLFTVAGWFHFANGIRHLLWDGPGIGFTPKIASIVSVFNFVFAIIAAVALWAIVRWIGG